MSEAAVEEYSEVREYTAAFEDIEGAVEADADGDDEDLGVRLCQIVKGAMRLETPQTAEELVGLLSRIARSTYNPTAIGMVLNNLGCVEKRRGNYKVALHHLKRAADEEGGIVAASPTTLLNISAVYSALQMYAEAASISNHAVRRCESDIQAASPHVHAAALYNLAAALEGSGELEHAAAAYKRAYQTSNLPADHPQSRIILKAQEQLELRLRNHRGNSKREWWSKEVLPAIVRKAGDKSINQGPPAAANRSSSAPANNSTNAANNTSTASHRLNPLLKRGLRKGQSASDPNAEGGHDAANASGGLTHTNSANSVLERRIALGLAAPDGKSMIGVKEGTRAHSREEAISSQYHQTVRDFHVFPVNSRAANKKHRAIENPTWDMNPMPHKPSVQRTLGKDPTVDRTVGMSYIPHHLVPFVADLKYKEHTRRTMIITDYTTRMMRLRMERDHAACMIEEDERRVDLEIDELRARKILQQWCRGRVVFVTHYSQVEVEERKARHMLHKALTDHIASLQPRAKSLQLQMEEEVKRAGITRQEQAAEWDALMIQHETDIVHIQSTHTAETPKAGIAHSLALWCLEGAIPPAAAAKLADQSYLQSYYVQSRHVWFGKPNGYGKPPQVVKAATDANGSPAAAPTGDFEEDEM